MWLHTLPIYLFPSCCFLRYMPHGLEQRERESWMVEGSRRQWRKLHLARGQVPPLLQMAGHRGTVSRTPNGTDHHESAHKTTNFALKDKKWRGTTKKMFPALRAGSMPPLLLWTGAPHIQIRSGATDRRSRGRLGFVTVGREAGALMPAEDSRRTPQR